MSCKMLKQVHRERYVPRLYQYVGAGAYPFAQRKTGSPPAIETLNGAWQIKLASASEAEVNGLYMGDCGPFRLQDLISVGFVVSLDSDDVNAEAVFGIVGAANDDYEDMAGLLFRVQSDGTVLVECNDGASVVQAAIETGIVLDGTPREFVINFREGVVLADPRLGGSYGGRGAIQLSVSDAAGNLQPICRTVVFDLRALTARLQLIAQIAKPSGTDASALALHGATVEWRWDTES